MALRLWGQAPPPDYSWLANDAGIKFPGEAFKGVSSLAAHDKMVETGHMWALLAVVGACEALHMSLHEPSCPGHNDKLDYKVHENADGSLKFDT